MFTIIKQYLKSLLIKQTEKNATPIIDKLIENGITNNIINTGNEPKWQTYFPFTFFFGGGKLQPLYCFVTLFSILSASMFYIKIAVAYKAFKLGTYTTDMISSSDLATVHAVVSSLILLYNNRKSDFKNSSDIKNKEEDIQQ
jgi:hypothetical protein